MSAEEAGRPGMIRRLARPRDWPSHAAAIAALIVVALLLFLFAHQRFGGQLAGSSRYRVTLDRIHLTPPPPWISSNAQALKKQAASLGQLSSTEDLRDPQLAVRVAEAFRRHPWVREVKQVVKQAPAHVSVDVEYRRPAAIVEHGDSFFLPVDVEGICLPTGDFTPEHARRYPRIADPGTDPQTKFAGYAWGDERVAGAARIAAALQPHWKDLPLASIHPPPLHPPRNERGPIFALETSDGRRILWGSPPGEELPGEAAAADKIAKLVEIFGASGPHPRTLPETLDLRHARGAAEQNSTSGE